MRPGTQANLGGVRRIYSFHFGWSSFRRANHFNRADAANGARRCIRANVSTRADDRGTRSGKALAPSEPRGADNIER